MITTLLRAMGAFENLPADQRAVLELVLRSGRSYDEIATILKIDRAAVRERALAALDALAPGSATEVLEARRALICDYLLGQLPAPLSEQVHERLGHEPAESAWAQTVRAELTNVTAAPLPEVPRAEQAPVRAGTETARAAESAGPARPPGGVIVAGERRSSRLGGAILLAAGALIAIAVIVIAIVVLSSGGASKHTATSGIAQTTPPTTTSTTGTASTPTSSKALEVTILSPATTSSSKAKGAAEIISEKGQLWLFLVAVHLTPTSHNYYAVWLTNGPSDSQLIGFQQVGSNGRLATFSNHVNPSYSRFKQMVVTLETSLHAKTPGTVVLSGPFNLK